MWKLKETSASTTSSFLPFHFHFSVLLFFIHGFSSAPLPTALPNPTATTATKQILQVINLSTLSIFFIIEIPNHFPSFPPFILPTLFDILFIFTISLCNWIFFAFLYIYPLYCFLLLSEICKQSMVRCHSRWRFTTLLICKINPNIHPTFLHVCKFFIFTLPLFNFGSFVFFFFTWVQCSRKSQLLGKWP